MYITMRSADRRTLFHDQTRKLLTRISTTRGQLAEVLLNRYVKPRPDFYFRVLLERENLDFVLRRQFFHSSIHCQQDGCIPTCQY